MTRSLAKFYPNLPQKETVPFGQELHIYLKNHGFLVSIPGDLTFWVGVILFLTVHFAGPGQIGYNKAIFSRIETL